MPDLTMALLPPSCRTLPRLPVRTHVDAVRRRSSLPVKPAVAQFRGDLAGIEHVRCCFHKSRSSQGESFMRYLRSLVHQSGTVLMPFLLVGSLTAFAQTNVLTWHNDNARTGQNLSEAILTPAKVNSANFGALFQVAVDGKVDAQPLYLSALTIPGQGTHNVVITATEHASVYAFDADTGKVLWKVSMLGNGETPSDPRNCNQVTPEIGITATPIIDRHAGAHGTVYLVAMSKDASGTYYQRIHALDLTSGAEQSDSPVAVQASYPGTGDNSSNGRVVFDPKQYVDRPGLLLLNGTVYTSWGSHCDIRPYTGWVIGYNQNTLQQNGVFNVTPNGNEAAPWNAGAGPAADAQGNIYLSLGNGTFDSTLNAQGFPNQGDFGNSLLKLTPSNGGITASDYWTMYNSNSESGQDTDLGSGGAMLLPDLLDAKGATRHLAVAAGKDSNLYVADRDNLGKYDASSNATLYQELAGPLSNGVWSSPAYFNGHVYYGSVNSVLRSFDVNTALLSSSPSSTTAATFNYPGTTPSISGYSNANAITWAVQNSNPAVLHAYDANNLATELYNSNQASSRDQFGAGNKFIVPTVANGKVFVGTQNSVAVFGLLRQTPAPIADGDYTLTNGASKLLLDDPGLSPNSGVQIIQWPANGGANQKWFFSYQGNGYYMIQNVSSGLFLTDPNAATAPGTALQQQTPANTNAQLWSLTPLGSGYLLQNKATGLVFDDPAGNPNQNTGIILYPRNSGSNQNWAIQQAN